MLKKDLIDALDLNSCVL